METVQKGLARSVLETPVVTGHDVVLAITEVHHTALTAGDDASRQQEAREALERAVVLFREHVAQETRNQFRKLSPRLRAP